MISLFEEWQKATSSGVEESQSLKEYYLEYIQYDLEVIKNNAPVKVSLDKLNDKISQIVAHCKLAGELINQQAHPYQIIAQEVAENFLLSRVLATTAKSNHLLNNQVLISPDLLRKFTRLKKKEPLVVYHLYSQLLEEITQPGLKSSKGGIAINRQDNKGSYKFFFDAQTNDCYIEQEILNDAKSVKRQIHSIKVLSVSVTFMDISEIAKQGQLSNLDKCHVYYFEEGASTFAMKYKFNIIDTNDNAYSFIVQKNTPLGKSSLKALHKYAKDYHDAIYVTKDKDSHFIASNHVSDVEREVSMAIEALGKKKK